MNDKFTPAFIEMCLDAHEAANAACGVVNPEARQIYTTLAYNTLPDALAEIKRLRGELSDAQLTLDEIVSMCHAAGMEPNTPAEAVRDVLEELNDVRRGNAALVAERDALLKFFVGQSEVINGVHGEKFSYGTLENVLRDIGDKARALLVTKSVTE